MRSRHWILLVAVLLVGCRSKHQMIRGGGFDGGAQIVVDPAPPQRLDLVLEERPPRDDADAVFALTVTATHAEGAEPKRFWLDSGDAAFDAWARFDSSAEGTAVTVLLVVRGDDVEAEAPLGDEPHHVPSDGSYDPDGPVLPIVWDYRNRRLFMPNRKAVFEVGFRGVELKVSIRDVK